MALRPTHDVGTPRSSVRRVKIQAESIHFLNNINLISILQSFDQALIRDFFSLTYASMSNREGSTA